MFLLSLLTTALASDSEHIAVARKATDALDTSTAAFVLWCQPIGDHPLAKKLAYIAPTYESDSAKLGAALLGRTDVETLVFMNNPTVTEVTEWLKGFTTELDGNQYREVLVSVACPATGGDTDEELLLTRDTVHGDVDGLVFAEFATAVAPIAKSSVWLLDASRDVTAALDPEMNAFGPTADDVTKYGSRDSLAISSGSPGKYAPGGLIMAAGNAIEGSKGAQLTLEAFYYRGIKSLAPTLDLYTSMGIAPGDEWNGNMARSVLIGIAPIAQATTPTAVHKTQKIPTGYYVAGAGVLAGVASSVFALEASNTYDLLVGYNEHGGESQAELDTAVNDFRLNTELAIGLGGAGILAIAGGVTWAILDHGTTTVEVTPTGTGAMVHGTF